MLFKNVDCDDNIKVALVNILYWVYTQIIRFDVFETQFRELRDNLRVIPTV